MDQNHPDYEIISRLRRGLLKQVGSLQQLESELPQLLQDAIDFVIDPVRTARTKISDLDSVEKTFIGLKIEHFLRDYLDVPKGIRDLVIDGIDVDVKNTIANTWTIPPETYGTEDPVLLIAVAQDDGVFSLGLMVARRKYLTSAKNRDAKLSVSAQGKKNIHWLVERAELPKSRWQYIDMQRFRDIRKIWGGTRRAVIFFTENIDRIVHRHIVEALLHDQKDYMKRLRKNGGARDKLSEVGIELLSGAYDSARIQELGLSPIAADEFVALRSESDV